MDWKTEVQMNSHAKLEIISVIIPSFFITFLCSTLSSYVQTNFLLEFTLITFPLILNYTVFVPHIHEFLFTLILTCISFLVITMNCRQESLVQSKKYAEKHVPFVTNARAIINLITGISILAVDFVVYPEQFSKTETYGFSLMDLGVGLFIYANGIVAPEVVSKKTFFGILKSSLPVLLLGFLRLISTTLLNYKVPETEYGLHWNFFFTLFFVKLFSSLIMNGLGNKYVLINAISLLFAYEILLQMGLARYVLSKDTPRDNLLNANREGLVSSFGYVALYFLSVYIGKELHLKSRRNLYEKFFLFKKMIVFAAMLFFSTVYSEKAFGVSRRLANTGYCIWTMFIGVFMTGLFCLGEIIQQYLFENKGYYKAKYVPQILDTINSNGLAFFLICNVLTGLINIFTDTKSYHMIDSLIVITIYMLLCCYFNNILYKNGIKLKF